MLAAHQLLLLEVYQNCASLRCKHWLAAIACNTIHLVQSSTCENILLQTGFDKPSETTKFEILSPSPKVSCHALLGGQACFMQFLQGQKVSAFKEQS